MIRFDETDPIGSVFAPLIGMPCWNAQKGHASFLTFEFGKPHLYIREPAANIETESPNVKRALQRRLVVPQGEWHLWIYMCNWRCSENQIESSHNQSADVQIMEAARFMNGQKLVSVGVGPLPGRSRFVFDLGATLETWPFDDPDLDNEEQWSLHTPEKFVLGYRADGHYAWAPDNLPEDQVIWTPLPPRQL